jgi:hypothetical protein
VNEDLQHSAAKPQPKARPPTQRNGGSRGLQSGSGTVGVTEPKTKAKPEKRPEGQEEKAKKIDAAEQQFQR